MRFFDNYVLPLIVLFIVFYDPLFYAFTSYAGISVESGMKQYEAIAIAAIVYSIMLFDIISKNIKKTLWILLIILAFILVLYLSSQLFYYDTPRLYYSHILLYGAMCIPASYIGTLLARRPCFERISYFIPFFIIPTSYIFLDIGFNAAAKNTILHQEDSGLNYQNLSYYFSFLYAYSSFFLFYSPIRKSTYHRLIRYPMGFVMFFCAIGCLISGGRGAFILLIVVSAFSIYSLYKLGTIRKSVITFIIILLFILLLIAFQHFDIIHSAGFERVSDNLFTDKNRTKGWEKALNAFNESPIWGHGLGSIWWTVGFYSHNFLTDLLAETGLIGTLIAIIILCKTFSYLYKTIIIKQELLFILLLFFTALIELLFSGYWISVHNLFFTVAFAYSHKTVHEIKYND